MKAVIYNQSCWVLAEGNINCLEFEMLLIQSTFTILGSIDHIFAPYGYTKIWLLGESHFALHTFPEENTVYLELSSCVEDKADLFWAKLNEWAQLHSKPLYFESKKRSFAPK